MENSSYTVILGENPSATEEQTDRLAALFRIPTEKARHILRQSSFVIKKDTDKKTAEKFHQAISALGIQCRIEENEAAETELPTIEEITPSADIKPLTDITQPEIPPLDEKSPHLSLQAGPVEKTGEGQAEERVIDDIRAENFCPECGTIRAAADSVCVHCGYNPVVVSKSRYKSVLMVLFILALLAAAAYPFYQNYARRAQIIDDLNLAFEIRNQITEFINRTHFWPNQNIDAGLDKQIGNASIRSIIVGENARLTVTVRGEVIATALGQESTDKTLIFVPKTLKGQVVWNCLKGTLQDELRPEICRKRVSSP